MLTVSRLRLEIINSIVFFNILITIHKDEQVTPLETLANSKQCILLAHDKIVENCN